MTEKTAHTSTRRTLTQTEKKYKELRETREPTVDSYFELGRISLEFGDIKEEEKKYKEAESLYHQAKDALKEAVKANKPEAHYYLARSYYNLASYGDPDFNFKKACAHANEAIKLAPRRKHERAEALKKSIKNCK